MSATFIETDSRQTLIGNINAHLRAAREARDGLLHDLAIMQTMITGDASNISQFDLVVEHGGYGGWTTGDAITDAMRAAAKASWDELNSLSFKLSSPSGTGDSTGAAISQACAKHGV